MVLDDAASACACMACWCLAPALHGELCDGCQVGHHASAMTFNSPRSLPPRFAATTTKKCRRHAWSKIEPIQCVRCGHPQDPARVRAGRLARKRGGRNELSLARALGGTKVGHHGGPEDVRMGMFNVQAKRYATARFPAWMSNELTRLPRTEGRIPVLIITESTGGRGRGRALAIMDLSDFRDLHGEVPT